MIIDTLRSDPRRFLVLSPDERCELLREIDQLSPATMASGHNKKHKTDANMFGVTRIEVRWRTKSTGALYDNLEDAQGVERQEVMKRLVNMMSCGAEMSADPTGGGAYAREVRRKLRELLDALDELDCAEHKPEP
jgi:hypothetical protein